MGEGSKGGCELEGTDECEGIDELVFPWGDDAPNCELTNYCPPATFPDCCGGDTSIVGEHIAGDSPYGVSDMSGNVWEWVEDWYSRDYYLTGGSSSWVDPAGPETGIQKSCRGGSFDTQGAELIRVSKRNNYDPDLSSHNLGFRCAKSP